MVTSLVDPVRIQVPRGGQYDADSNPDGTWNVRDVPVFVAFDDTYDLEWLQGAVAVAQARYREDHVAPLHTHHHNFAGESYETDAIEDAGLFLPTRVGSIVYEGRVVPAVFADFLAVPDAIYQRVKSRELKYRSIEVLDNRKTEINSCALLSHECPKFRLPMLTIGRENGLSLAAAEAFDLSHAGRFVFSAQEESFVSKKDDKFAATSAATSQPSPSDQMPTGTPPAPAGGQQQSLPAQGSGGQNNAQLLKMIKKAAKKAAKKALAKYGGAAPGGDPGNGMPPTGAGTAVGSGANTPITTAPGTSSSGGVFQEPPRQNSTLPVEQRGNMTGAAFSELKAKMKEIAKTAEKAHERNKKLEYEIELGKAISAAKFRLEKAGTKVDEAYELELRAKAEKGLGVLEEHVATREKFRVAEPPRWTGREVAGTPSPGAPSASEAKTVIDKFAAKGPDFRARAEEAYAEWLDIPELMRAEISAEDFVKYSLEGAPGVQHSHNGKSR